ncbi:hypothetical protein [Sphingopyxis sp. PET50]|uniref:hypothetical protein n=1 Tax=Sphingopyxis sp. PET50 TaxID=2976533 RepID=UPI0021AF4B25|nr:hypothetical protein [Sphingopyxis sp. PET50]
MSLERRNAPLARRYTEHLAVPAGVSSDRSIAEHLGDNLTNTHYRPLAVYQTLGAALGLNNGAFPGSTANRILANEPRTYDVSATFHFAISDAQRCPRLYRHSEDGELKMVVFRDPERSALDVREHRKRGKPPFAGRQG